MVAPDLGRYRLAQRLARLEAATPAAEPPCLVQLVTTAGPTPEQQAMAAQAQRAGWSVQWVELVPGGVQP